MVSRLIRTDNDAAIVIILIGATASIRASDKPVENTTIASITGLSWMAKAPAIPPKAATITTSIGTNPNRLNSIVSHKVVSFVLNAILIFEEATLVILLS